MISTQGRLMIFLQTVRVLRENQVLALLAEATITL